MKNLCMQLLTLVRATPGSRKYILPALGIGLAGSLIGIYFATAGDASITAYVLTR